MNSKKKTYDEFFAERVKLFRIKLGLSQQQLGDIVGLSKQAINNIENCRRSTTIHKAITIAQFFNTTVEYLCGVTDNSSRDWRPK